MSAGNPIITRNFPLNKPGYVQYSVYTSGYFCTAIYSTTSDEVSLTMHAIDRGHELPAFRQGSLATLRIVAPICLLLFPLWLRANRQCSPSKLPTALSAAIFLSVTTSMIRWASLEAFDSIPKAGGLKMALAATANVLLVIQDTTVVGLMRSATSDTYNPMGAKYRHVLILATFTLLFVFGGISDFIASDANAMPAVAACVTGFALSICCFYGFLACRRLCRLLSATKALRAPFASLKRSLCGFAICFGLIASINFWMLFHEHGFLFGEKYWKWRGMVMDLPYELLVLQLVGILAQFFLKRPSRDELLQALDGEQSKELQANGVE